MKKAPPHALPYNNLPNPLNRHEITFYDENWKECDSKDAKYSVYNEFDDEGRVVYSRQFKKRANDSLQ